MPEGMINSFLITGTTLFAAMSNNLLVVFNEGIHEGQAYNTSLYYFKPYSFDLKNFVFERRSEFLSNNMTYETGKELMQSSSNVILQFTPLKPTLQVGGAALPSALQFGAKQSIKMATPCVMLQKGVANHNLYKILQLPEAELEKVLRLFINLFKIGYQRRFEQEKGDPNKWWYWDLSDDRKIEIIKKNMSN